MRWEGWMAPAWTAVAPDGSVKGHAALAGRPYVALLVLGGSCGHCNEQIKAFGDQAAAYKAADLPVVVVTVDKPEELPANPVLPVWSGADTAAFKALDAWDDFENQPLHTTVLVDATGRIRWQHSGYEPFMRPDFLLEEAQRLFKFDRTRPATLAATGWVKPANGN
jgi:peroxiredoxin